VSFLAQVAQVAAEHQALYTYGPLGIICGWLMWRDEKRAAENRSFGSRIDGLTKAILADMMERENCGEHARSYAREEMARINSRGDAK
jgi:hypothetical protein